MNLRKALLCLPLLACLAACDGINLTPIDPGQKPSDKDSTEVKDPEKPDDPVVPAINMTKTGLEYMYDTSVIPEIHVKVSAEQWAKLLSLYDANPKTKQYVSCDITYIKGEEKTDITNAGLRLRGNTSRRRPQDNEGRMHHCHFGLNFRKFVKDSDHEIHGARKANLKWFKDDAAYVRELYCYDLFRRDSVWTAPFTTYCRLWLEVDGKETYYGVYDMIEPIDTRYLKARATLFEGADGNLWKCRWGASLNSTNANFGVDDGSDAEFTYEMKSDDNDFEAAKQQLQDFILKLNGKGDDSFYQWIQEVCDVPLLLRTYAVNVVCGMWDDYWNNCNNYYIYFNTTDKYDYKFFFIPYDYDNTLGTSSMMDSGRQDPFNWGNNSNPLIYRLLKFEDFREIYRQALLELVDEKNALFYYTASIQRIENWQMQIKDYVSNDTGEDCSIRDVPASWGNHEEYRLLETGSNNFFQVKTETINKYCK